MNFDPASAPLAAPARRQFIASPWHTLSILLIFGYFGFRQGTPQLALNPDTAQAAVSHAAILRGYLISIATEWGMAYWVWAGVHWKGGHLRDLTGGRWTTWRSLALDVAIAIPFWFVWELTAYLVHLAVDRIPASTAAYHVPSGFAEVFLWILLSVSAGICEEIVFRGYLQQQFHAATRSIVAAVILQGAVFGLAHSYQGWKQVIVIAALGILYGALVAWRRNLRASMLAHAWSDIFEGYVKFLWLARP
jgi:membrane protease YdiL (CAAX protease family)